MKLTIAIPTFDRPTKAIELLNRLHEQAVGANIELYVADNDSKFGKEIELAAKQCGANYIKRQLNIGPTANILRVFEEVIGEWVVIFGDDDLPSENYIETVLTIIQKKESKKLIGIKFRTAIDSSQEDFEIEDLSKFTKYNSSLKRFGSTLFLSSWVFRRSEILRNIRLAYLYAGAHGGHLIILMKALQERRGSILYSKLSPLQHKSPPKGTSWSAGLVYTMMIPTVSSVHFLNKSHTRDLLFGIVGSNSKNILGNLLRLRIYNSGQSFSYVSKIISHLSFSHSAIVFLFTLVYPFLPKIFIQRHVDFESETNGLARM